MRDGQRVPLTVQPEASSRRGWQLRRARRRAHLGHARATGSARAASRTGAAGEPGSATPPAPPTPPARGFFEFDELLGRGSGAARRHRPGTSAAARRLLRRSRRRAGHVSDQRFDGGEGRLKAGDVITTLNGAACRRRPDLRRRAMRLEDGAELTLGVVRDKKAMTLKGKVEGRSTRANGDRTRAVDARSGVGGFDACVGRRGRPAARPGRRAARRGSWPRRDSRPASRCRRALPRP